MTIAKSSNTFSNIQPTSPQLGSDRFRRIMFGLLATTAPLGFATPALAQDGAAAAATAAEGREIIVTAQRRSERLEDVPMSVSVISQETLATTGVTTIRDLAQVTTGFQVGNGGVFPQAAIRGITTINAGFYENNVSLYVDGVYQITSQILQMDLPNVQNIQVLKGPQGTLYGRNATGGTILLDTIDPTSDWTANAEFTYARFDDKRVRGFLAGPITDRIGISLAGTWRRTDGYFKVASRTTPGEFNGRGLGLDQESFRAKLKFDLTDTFTATVGYNYMLANDLRGGEFTPIENVSAPYTAPGNDTRPTVLGAFAGDAFDNTIKQNEAFLKMELETSIGTLKSVTAYTVNKTSTYYDFAGSYLPDFYSGYVIRDRAWQSSLDYSIDAIDNLDLVVGGNYFNSKTNFLDDHLNSFFVYAGPAVDPGTTIVPLSSYALSNERQFKRTKESWAIFADATFHVSDRISLNVGGRYTEETQDVAAQRNFYSLATGALTATPYTLASSARSSKYTKFTPRASVRYEISPGTNIYASYSKGFRSGEWVSDVPNDNLSLWQDANPETIDAYEIGLKSARRGLRFDLAGFYYDYKDLQVAFTSQVNGQPVVLLQNAPSAEIYGIEGNIDYEVVDNFNLHAGATWLHARYGDGFVFTGSGVNPAGTGYNTNSDPLKVFPNVTVSQDLSGLQMSRAPNWAAFGGFDYTVPTSSGEFLLAANAKYTSSYVVTNPSVWGGDPTYDGSDPNVLPDNTVLLEGTPYVGSASKQRARQSGYVLLSASVTWTDPSDHFYVRLWGTNLTNQTYRIHKNPIFTGTYQPIGEPRVIGGTIGFKY